MTATLAQHIAARGDSDLQQRMIAAAEQAGVNNAVGWVGDHAGDLVSAPLTGSTSLAEVHAYATAQRAAALAAVPPPPGLDPAVVTDALITEAVQAVLP